MADPKKKTSVQAEIIFFVLIVAILFVFCYHYAFADETQTNEITGNQNTINFGWWGNDERHDYTLQGIDIFEQKNPSINVNCTYSVWSGYERRNRIYMRSGSEPDVMQINYNWISEYSPDGNGYYNLYDLSDYIDLSSYTENELSYGTVNGKLNALPIAYNSVVFFYNQDLLDQYGLDVPKTWDDLFACADVLEPTGVLLFDASQKNQWITLVAHEEQITGKKAFGEFDAENVKSMFEFEAQLINEGVFSREDNNKEKFLDKKSAGVIRWVSDAQFYVVPLEDRGGTVTVGDYICEPDCKRLGWYVKPTCLYAISRSVKHPEQAAKLVDFLLNSEKMARLQGTEKGVPLSKSALETLDVSNMLTGVSYEASMKITDRQDMELMAPELEDTARIEDFFRLFDLWYYGQTELDEAAETFVADYPFS